METFLAPVERPKNLLMKLFYAFFQSSFGKVITPLKVHSARMPVSFFLHYIKTYSLEKKLKVGEETALLVREMVSRQNGCLFCMDAHRFATVAMKGLKECRDKLEALIEYQSSPLFSEAERTMLDYVCELTRKKKVEPETFARMGSYWTEREICEIVWLVATEHMNSMTNLGLNIHSDMLCDLALKNRKANRSEKSAGTRFSNI